MTGIVDFGFDDGKVIKSAGIERFSQNKNEKHRVSIVAFKRFHDVVLAQKTRDKGRPLSDQEKTELFTKIDSRLAESQEKSVEELTEVDRLDRTKPRFSYAFTHYNEDVGTIRCLGKYESSELIEPGLCCDKFGDASQTIGTLIMIYPVDEHLQADMDLLKAKKYTYIRAWRVSSKKYKKLEGCYKGALSEGQQVIDMKIELDGDPKYQRQIITSGGTAAWARDTTDPEIKQWALQQGLRNYKHVNNYLGFELSKERLAEKLGIAAASSAALGGSEASASTPRLNTSYDELLS